MQQVHSYQTLVDNNLVSSLENLLGYENELLFLELHNDTVVFKIFSNNTIIYPGINIIEKIINSIKEHKEFLESIN
jgi:hypothetical protein